jgi:hypothetical protein
VNDETFNIHENSARFLNHRWFENLFVSVTGVTIWQRTVAAAARAASNICYQEREVRKLFW